MTPSHKRIVGHDDPACPVIMSYGLSGEKYAIQQTTRIPL